MSLYRFFPYGASGNGVPRNAILLEAVRTYTISRPPLRITCLEEVRRETAEKWLEEHGSWFDGGRGARDPWEGRPHFYRIPGPDLQVLLKREARPLSRILLYALAGRPSRTKKAFAIGLALRESGVRAARPLAFIERTSGGLVRESCLILEVADGLPLRELLLARLKSFSNRADGERFKERLWTAVAHEVARLHAASVRQRDLKAPNVLVKEEGDGCFTVTLLDLEGMTKLAGPPSRRARIRDLARLLASLREEEVRAAGVSPEDWTFLVARYLDAQGRVPSPDELSAFVQATLCWAARKEARNRRRGRVIR